MLPTSGKHDPPNLGSGLVQALCLGLRQTVSLTMVHAESFAMLQADHPPLTEEHENI